MNKKRQRRQRPSTKTPLDDVVDNFVPCGRCSFFLAGYRVIHGKESLEEAAARSDESWLELACDAETRKLLEKSYGSRLDVGIYYLDGRCPECQRRFIYRQAEEDGDQSTLQFELKSI